jgi:hypothetical protein
MKNLIRRGIPISMRGMVWKSIVDNRVRTYMDRPQPDYYQVKYNLIIFFFCGLECVGHSFAFVAHFVLFGYVWIRTQSATIASRLAINLSTRLSP